MVEQRRNGIIGMRTAPGENKKKSVDSHPLLLSAENQNDCRIRFLLIVFFLRLLISRAKPATMKSDMCDSIYILNRRANSCTETYIAKKMKKNNAKCNLYVDCICTTRQTEAKTDGPKVRESPIYPCQKQRAQSVLNDCAYIFRVSMCLCRHKEGNGALAMVNNFLKNDDFSFHLHLYGGSTISTENERKE